MDIVERLRRINAFLHITEDEPEYDYKLSYEAADEIERLRKESRLYWDAFQKAANEIERLQGVLRNILDLSDDTSNAENNLICISWVVRAALKEGK